MKLNVTLCSINGEMINEWRREFTNYSDVKLFLGDILEQRADAVVSPANSFGFMDGGLDHHIREYFGEGIQNRLQDKIREEYLGELAVGQAAIIDTKREEIPYLISAPTMRVPMSIQNTMNVYLATRAVFIAIKEFNSIKERIRSVLIPAMGAGTGMVPFMVAAKQMRAAYENILRKYRFPDDLGEAIRIHRNTAS